ncbi:DUF1788 domain-containing protein [Rhodanobacter sp. B2A1Ga4]|uniref:DUF1788 domain-containing protein n=1 Tax=Rhodanobacter sp. B2A1Ga4 TaxID=2778647 RepID=UPI001B359669|nr:DUF1788 domain-containing protein [Rhodanobacter sp. B2A1Ga4]MBQ4853605.1 DUF1788 domain-containing protein [Rhodanobacter sp. B2A1Ga4]
MSDHFRERLNRILPKISSADFLTNKGLGNEIGFWVFDYPAEQEMVVRGFIADILIPGLARQQPVLRPAVVNLFDLIVDLLEDRKLYDRVLSIQNDKGNDAALAALRPVLKEDKLAQRIASQIDFQQVEMLLLTGVGAAYPMLRSHTLLTALQPIMNHTPVVMFYPGRYDGFSLRLFNTLADDHYYRAFRLAE